MFRRKECYFDRNNIEFIDYTDTALLQRYLSSWAKVKPAKDTGTCRRHQRKISQAIKRARYLALLPYTTR